MYNALYNILLIVCCNLGGSFATIMYHEAPDKELNLSEMLVPVGQDQIFKDSAYYNWGSSIIKSEDGKYHLFYSRWPKKYTFTAWLTHSEIAHAVSDNPYGPYRYVETSLSRSGTHAWETITAHNPKIKFFDGKYYLYYISTSAGGKSLSQRELIETARVGYKHKNWPILRNNQRTGVAVSTSLYGPWERSKTAIVEPGGPITTLTVNPAVCKGKKGMYLMIVKGDKPNETKFIRNQALAVATTPAGPFQILPQPVIANLDTEDMSMWHDSITKHFYAIFHTQGFIGLMSSTDGYSWQKATNYKVTPKKIKLQSGEILRPDRMERPFVFVEHDHPSVLSFAIKKGDDAYCLFVPLKDK